MAAKKKITATDQAKLVVRPITPDEAASAEKSAIPPEVLKAFNELIAENYRFGEARVPQKDVVRRIKEIMPRKVTDGTIVDSGGLDVEDIFRGAGWEVTYDRPAYFENYEAFFVFSPQRKG